MTHTPNFRGDFTTTNHGLVVAASGMAERLSAIGLPATTPRELLESEPDWVHRWATGTGAHALILPTRLTRAERSRWAAVLGLLRRLGVPARVVRELGDRGRS